MTGRSFINKKKCKPLANSDIKGRKTLQYELLQENTQLWVGNSNTTSSHHPLTVFYQNRSSNSSLFISYDLLVQ